MAVVLIAVYVPIGFQGGLTGGAMIGMIDAISRK